MAETLIARTRSQGLRPLGAAAQRNHALITEQVATRLSPAHAMLFSEPSPTPDGAATDWYAQLTGVVRRLDGLEAAEAEAVWRRLGDLVGDVLALADDFDATGGEDGRRLAEALRNALEVPDGRAIWLVGDQPVLVNWAHCRDADKAPAGIIRRLVPAKPVPPPSREAATLAVAAERQPVTLRDVLWWFGWLALGIVAAWVLWLLIAPCAIRGPAVLDLDMCPKSLAHVLTAETDRRAALEDRVAALERDLARTSGTCLPAPPSDEEPSDLLDTVLEEGGMIGRVNVILAWRDGSDLDLAVICPSGSRIDFQNYVSCGGELDVDANVDPVSLMDSPVENVVFDESPVPGRYRVHVNLFNQHGERGKPEHRFTVTVIVDGEETVRNGSVSMDRRQWSMTFDYGES